tara:strand:+ start:119 stop:565 length:447 start_codon:yes stop_codon:yes gene_type:complete
MRLDPGHTGTIRAGSAARKLLADGGGIEAHAAQVTMLFCGIEGFSLLTEVTGPRATVEILNAFFSEMVTVLEDYGGTVTQFQGDAILATFNVPIGNPEHAQNTLSAALAMLKRTKFQWFAGRSLSIRVGVNTDSAGSNQAGPCIRGGG